MGSKEKAGGNAAEKMTLLDAEIGMTYIVKDIDTDDTEMNAFLFRLGCYSGEPVTLISKKKKKLYRRDQGQPVWFG